MKWKFTVEQAYSAIASCTATGEIEREADSYEEAMAKATALAEADAEERIWLREDEVSVELIIAETLRARCSPEKREAVRERCWRYVAGSEGLAILDNRQPCPLLWKDCAPSTSTDRWRARATSGTKLWGIHFALSIIEGVKEALQSHRIDGRRFRLPHALLIVLEQSDAIDRYLRGEKVFNEAY